ncbi:MAG: hypothetical protein R3C12_25550 [Planctomycetaceae bacterium]|nr:hypothetical protein [Planctomycetaceae bacterium]
MKTGRFTLAKRGSWWILGVLVLTLGGVIPPGAWGQKSTGLGSKPGGRGGNVVTVDKKAEEARESFLRTSAELAREYEDLGELEKAQEVLRSMLKLAPGTKPIEEKIKQLDEVRLAQNEADTEVDASRGWVAARVAVEKGKVIRFQAEGDCRVTFSQLVNPEGVAAGDVKTEMALGVPFGALMGMIVDDKGKPGQPFHIGQKNELNADATGQLFLRVNLPPQAKATGKYRVRITGDIKSADASSTGR